MEKKIKFLGMKFININLKSIIYSGAIRSRLKRRNLANNKGALTVEACIALPFFLGFLLLIAFFIKVACINITLNHAVNETVKQIATSSYPLSFLNEMEEDLIGNENVLSVPTFSEEKNKLAGYVGESLASKDVISSIMTGSFGVGDLSNILSSVAGSMEGDIKSGLRQYLINACGGKYLEVKTKAKYIAAKFLIDKFCDESFVDKRNIDFILVEVPQSDWEYTARESDKELYAFYKDIGYLPNKDNVVVSIEYKIKIPIPFFGEKELALRCTAVEKAWLYGSNGIYTVSDKVQEKDKDKEGEEGDKDNGDTGDGNNDYKDEIVYITKTGMKYHYAGCQYLAKSKIPIKLREAERRGYKPCEICVLGKPKFGGHNQ